MEFSILPKSRSPHPANCAGDFYVEKGCCIACGVPVAEAPEVFGWAPDGDHCVVAKQPRTPSEINDTLSAMLAGEVDCIRYRGSDPDISTRIVEMGYASSCDLEPPADARPLVRSHVTFRSSTSVALDDASQLALEFRQHFLQNSPRWTEVGAKAVPLSRERASAHISWYEGIYHIVEFGLLPDGAGLAVTMPKLAKAGVSLSRRVDGWLRAGGIFHDIRWFSAEQWHSGGPYRPTVI